MSNFHTFQKYFLSPFLILSLTVSSTNIAWADPSDSSTAQHEQQPVVIVVPQKEWTTPAIIGAACSIGVLVIFAVWTCWRCVILRRLVRQAQMPIAAAGAIVGATDTVTRITIPTPANAYQTTPRAVAHRAALSMEMGALPSAITDD